MTKELKTLKDLCPHAWIVGKDRLRAEAMRYIKEIGNRVGEYGEYTKEADAVAFWFKHFFNITDDDLGVKSGGQK